MANPNLQLLTDAAKLLKPILGELVFVGGCATALLITDSAAADVRPTFDVDAIAEITSYAAYAPPYHSENSNFMTTRKKPNRAFSTLMVNRYFPDLPRAKQHQRNGNFAFLINSEYHPKAHSTSNSDHRNPLECLPVTQQVSAKATL
jgi:hypothetical protein